MTKKKLLILGAGSLALAGYWRYMATDITKFPGKFFYRPEAALIYSYGAAFIGTCLIISGIVKKDAN